ncbi:ddx-52 [Pristionchus pacificus]|uniref:ATP-dependent RNA helicase n=1 Tax=Pristionchus pacificus TaxID=54126 RepID=A0A2A6CCA3_PRIPA|nr:ddx-52 [Pristionchus pacificus]|eukprot:PDM75730.1 helicase [Pristionchus pacificus]
MVADDILRKLTFGVKKPNKAKKADDSKKSSEKELRLRIVPEEVKRVLREEVIEEKEDEEGKIEEESDSDNDSFTILTGSKLASEVDEAKKQKRKRRKEGNTAEHRQQMIARLRRVNRMFSWGDDIPEPIIDWTDLPEITDRIRSNLTSSGIIDPSPIQMQSIPMMMKRRNVLASAPTGSGKTLAFALPVILDVLKYRSGVATVETANPAPVPAAAALVQMPSKKKAKLAEKAKIKDQPEVVVSKDRVLAIVLEPTRELAKQTYRQILKFAEGEDVTCALLEEGMEVEGRNDILVSTPNRLVHRLEKMDLSGLRWLVVDESDRLFDNTEGDEKCFRNQLAAIYKACDASKDVRRAFFSATFSYEVEEWCKENLPAVAMLCIGERNSSNTSVSQKLVYTGSEQGKIVALRDLLYTRFEPPAIVFVQSKERARQLMSAISSMATAVPTTLITSEKSAEQREAALESFRSGRAWVLVCTEIMGRGLDLPAVNLVVNFDLPASIVSYIHRVGRTGRGGRAGAALTYFTEHDMAMVRPIANVISQAGFEVPPYTLLLKPPTKKDKKYALKHAPRRNDVAFIPRKQNQAGKRKETGEKVKQGGKRAEKGDKKDGKKKEGEKTKINRVTEGKVVKKVIKKKKKVVEINETVHMYNRIALVGFQLRNPWIRRGSKPCYLSGQTPPKQLRAWDVEKREELDNMAASFRAVVASKNRKIKDLEEDLSRLKIKSLEEQLKATQNSGRVVPIDNGVQMVKSSKICYQKTQMTSGTVRARFAGITRLQTVNVSQGSVRVAGLNWGIDIRANMDKLGGKKFLAVFLAFKTRPVSESWSAKAYYTIKMINQDCKNKSHVRADNESIYTSTCPSWGLRKFISFEDLLNPANGYVKDNSILLEIDFIVFPAQ